MSPRTPKYVIIDRLFENSVGKTALSRECNLSIPKASRALEELIEIEVVKKTDKGNTYHINPEILYVILKLSGTKAELISYTNNKNVTRQALEPLYSLSADENVSFFAQSVKEYCASLENKYFSVIPCVICDGTIAPSKISVPHFTMQMSRQDLITSAISELFSNESVLYINLEDPFCMLCKNGEVFSQCTSLPQKLEDTLKDSFLLFKPDRVVLNGQPCKWLSDLCEQEHISFSLLSPSTDGLYIDERRILIEAICNMK